MTGAAVRLSRSAQAGEWGGGQSVRGEVQSARALAGVWSGSKMRPPLSAGARMHSATAVARLPLVRFWNQEAWVSSGWAVPCRQAGRAMASGNER